MTTKIKTREQAEAAIRAIEAKPEITHHDRVIADAIKAALDQVDHYEDWGRQIAAHNSHGDVTLRNQTVQQRAEWVDTRMSGLARRLAGIED